MSDAASDHTSTVATLHVFSGVHLGAHIDLTAGSWLLGSDDTCDLILNGLAPRHAELRVSVDEAGTVTVTVVPQEAHVFVDGTALEEETPLEAGAAWYLGETCFAWNVPGAVQETVLPQHVGPAVGQGESEPDSVQGTEPDMADHASEVGETPVAEEPQEGQERETLSVDGNLPAMSAGFQPVHMDESMRNQRVPLRQRWGRPVSLLFMAILLCALSFVFSSGPSRSQYPAIVKGILEKAGLTGLAVTPRWPGVEVRGAVASAGSLEKLQQAVQEVSFPVYLEVAVDDDMLRAVRNALGIRGFFPAVRMERSGGEPQLLVAAYMRDTLVEADAFAQLEKDVPSPPEKKRRIVYEKDAAPKVLAALQNAGFNDIHPVFLPGRITLSGNIAQERAVVLARMKAELNAQFGVPLFGEGAQDLNTPPPPTMQGISPLPAVITAQTSKTSPDSSSQPGENSQADPLGGLTLTGVFAAPLDFVTTEDGRRFFPGSVLPNGTVLERITTTGLTLRRGDSVFTYNLRGHHE